MSTKTFLPKVSEIQRQWHVIDATGKALGRIATNAANILRGKDKAFFTPSVDCGGFVVITNAEKVLLTGKKLEQKIDWRHSGYPGGDSSTPYSRLMAEHPERALQLAIKGMLPHNRLGSKQYRRLKVYKGPQHPHGAQIVKAEKASA